MVVGVILHADTQFAPLAARINETLDQHVPKAVREGFVFHATEVYSGGKRVDRDTWPFSGRIAFLEAMLGIPRALNLPISFGTCARTTPLSIPPGTAGKLARIRPEHEHHVNAFLMFAASAENYLRRETDADEIAMLICEQTEVGKFFPKVLARMKDKPVFLDRGHLRPTVKEQETGVFDQMTEIYSSKIVETVSFASKKQSPHLQVADACAFAVRSWLSGQRHGLQLMTAITGGPPPPVEDFSTGTNGQTLQWTPPKR